MNGCYISEEFPKLIFVWSLSVSFNCHSKSFILHLSLLSDGLICDVFPSFFPSKIIFSIPSCLYVQNILIFAFSQIFIANQLLHFVPLLQTGWFCIMSKIFSMSSESMSSLMILDIASLILKVSNLFVTAQKIHAHKIQSFVCSCCPRQSVII